MTSHFTDYVVCIVLLLTILLSTLIPTFDRYISKKGDPSLTYPQVAEYVPSYALTIICVVIPFGVIISTQVFVKQRSLHDVHHALLGFAEANILTIFINTVLKRVTSRYRPFYSTVAAAAATSSSSSALLRAKLGFPSGHASTAFCSMLFVSLYLAGKTRLFSKHSHSIPFKFPRLLLVASPLLLATLIAVSRTMDYHHFYTDIVTGALLGIVVALVCYFVHYSSLFGKHSHLPLNSWRLRKQLLTGDEDDKATTSTADNDDNNNGGPLGTYNVIAQNDTAKDDEDEELQTQQITSATIGISTNNNNNNNTFIMSTGTTGSDMKQE